MAYIRKRGNTWYYTVDVGLSADGKRDQNTKGGFKTKKDAQLAANKIEEEVSDGLYVRQSNTTFYDFTAEWLDLYRDNVKESTVRIRTHEIACLKSKIGEHIKIKDISARKYEKVLTDLKKDGYSTNTLIGIHGTAKMIFNKAVEFKMIKVNPTQYAKIPRECKTVEELEQETEIPKYFEKEELSLFLKTAQHRGLESDYIVFLVFAYTGMRAGELCALKWSDINFAEQEISITKTYYNPNNKVTAYKLHTPKTKSSKRTNKVDPIVISELENHRTKQDAVKNKHEKEWHNNNFVFAKLNRNYGYPIYIKLIDDRMKRLLRISGLNQDLTPHSLRHTHTSLLAEAGVGLEEIMERLGHADDVITRNIYLHVTKAKKKEASQKFSELMKNI
jgi:integrase